VVLAIIGGAPPPSGITIVAVEREDRMLGIDPETSLRVGDRLAMYVASKAKPALLELLSTPRD
jgi:Trk K+ transport system NAD-binding subunit